MSFRKEFVPKIYDCFRSGYSWATFRKDCIAGITVGIIALPLATAFGIASGASPGQGLITAVVAGFLISMLGGSRVQIGGPTGAFVVLIYGIIERNGYPGLVASTIIASVLLVVFGLFRLGSWIKYIPHPLVTGFTTGIAVLIGISQLKGFFGVASSVSLASIPPISPYAVSLGAGTLIFSILIKKIFPKIPWAFSALVLAGVAVYFFSLPVATIASEFPDLPKGLSWPSLPDFRFSREQLPEIFFDGMAIAFLGAIESLLSAVIGDGMIGGRHRSNCELIAQGIANFGSVLFGGIPATGAIARTAVNVKSGGRTPVAGIIHACTVFGILLGFSVWIGYVPLPALAAVLLVVAWNMSEGKHFISLCKAPLGDVAVLLTAFFLTVFVDITVAITLGMILSCFLFMKRMSTVSHTVSLRKVLAEEADTEEIPVREEIPEGIEVYEVRGPFFFACADMLQDILAEMEKPPLVCILRLPRVSFLDASGMRALEEFYEKCRSSHTVVLLAEVPPRAKKDLLRFGSGKIFGENRFFSRFTDALRFAKNLL